MKSLIKKVYPVNCLILTILLIFSGCIQPSQDNTNKDIDSDNDGYNDNIDHFDTDPNLHEKVVIHNSMGSGEESDEKWIISSGSWKDIYWDVPSDSKYVDITVSTSKIENGEYITDGNKASVMVSNPEETFEIEWGETLPRITVTTENWGQWRLWVTNTCENNVEVSFTILIYK